MIIALLTDFGTKDYFVGAMKGVILSINPEAKIIDISHEIQPQNIQAAGFILASCYQNFPPKTIFVSIIDPGVGSERRAILVETENYYFISPDNDLLSLVLANESNYRVFELTNPQFFNQPVSNTFHGRDIFAPVAAWLSRGIKPCEFGKELKTHNSSTKPSIVSEKKVEGRIIHIDNFGNLITNLKKSDLPTKFSLKVNENIVFKHHNYYAEAEKDEIFMIFGSAGYLEIVAFCNSAQNLLNVKLGQIIEVVAE